MMTMTQAIEALIPLDTQAMRAAQNHWNSIAKPLNSLGLLEKAVIQIAGITANSQCDIDKRGVVIMCADNGVVTEGVTQTGSEVTAIVAKEFTLGCTSVCKMAQVAGADIFPVDIGMCSDVEGVPNRKTAYGTQNIARGPAMTRQQAVDAIEVGIDMVYRLKQKGYKILATGEMGIGNTTTSSAIAAVLLGQDAAVVTGRGAGLSDSGLCKKREVIARAIALNQPDPQDALDVLSKVGGFDIAGLVGVFLGGAALHVPILIDGVISAVAALIAVRLAPLAGGYMLASHRSGEPAGQMILSSLEKEPFLTAGMCLGEGTGAVAALPILDMAFAVYHTMSTFHDIHIDAYQAL
jgi:nicotinate-nucleotide--dimethylbenzimidazole phosphoribosyltransferase